MTPLLLVAALVAPACRKADSMPAAGKSVGGGSATIAPGAAKLEMFVMSQCPYGVQVENAVAPVKAQLGEMLDVQVHYIGDGDATSLTSMHGPSEVMGDIVQLCANKIAPAKNLDFIVCQNKNMRAVAENWKACAKEVGVDEAALSACAEGEEGKQLLAASFAEAKKRGASGSPTMFLNGQPYQGGRKSRDFLKASCQVIAADKKPEACKSIPEPPAVAAVFLSDARCKECDIKALEPRLKAELGGLTVKHVDYMSDEGKALYAKVQAAQPGFKFLPAVLLDKAVEKDADGYAVLKGYLRPAGDWHELQLGGKFDPTAEICDNGKLDDDGDGKADCDDDGCAGSLSCREARPKTIEMFVMSQCPYGAKAMIAANDVAQHFGKEITIDVHFIGGGDENSLQAMHGQSEVDENIRELCAREKYPKDHQFLKYMACRSKNYRSPEWQGCATESGMDPAVIQACFDGPGKKLLAEDYKVANALGIGASPTFLGNGRREFNAIEAGPLQKQFCTDNPDVKGCKDVLTAVDPAGAAPVDPGACGN